MTQMCCTSNGLMETQATDKADKIARQQRRGAGRGEKAEEGLSVYQGYQVKERKSLTINSHLA